MIFYFSGTGNSLFAAQQLKEENETLVNMAEAMKKKAFHYTVDHERVGFVFPVYFYTVNTYVEKFISELDLQGATYIYAVITCGGGISQAGVVFKKLLAKKGLALDYVSDLLMPDNSMLFYQIPDASAGKDRIEKAIVRCAEIKREVQSEKKMGIGNVAPISDLLYQAYKLCQKTDKFWVETDKCISCGLCERNCPESAILLKEGHPLWIKEKCCKCSSCINRCPVEAIQYGKGTKKRNRYYLNKE